MKIIAANEDHVPAIVGMMREFAIFEKLEQFFEITEDRLRIALFGETKIAEALVAFDGDTPAAYAVFYPNFATFRGQRGFYLEDVYIREAYRGQRLGERILREIARLGRERGYERIDFHVLNWNEPAIGFYKKLGANDDPEDLHFKFTDQAFEALAEGGPWLRARSPKR
ncbi:MAG: GNAT family N-acetyltransferase [Acidobacteria bacterium]|nr:GNAT family N-acetyltransferase [Acidobacteriota bacterium]